MLSPCEGSQFFSTAVECLFCVRKVSLAFSVFCYTSLEVAENFSSSCVKGKKIMGNFRDENFIRSNTLWIHLSTEKIRQTFLVYLEFSVDWKFSTKSHPALERYQTQREQINSGIWLMNENMFNDKSLWAVLVKAIKQIYKFRLRWRRFVVVETLYTQL